MAHGSARPHPGTRPRRVRNPAAGAGKHGSAGHDVDDRCHVGRPHELRAERHRTDHPPTSGPTATTGPAGRTVDVFTAVLRNLIGQDPAIGGAAGAKVLFVWDELDGSVARGPMQHVVGSISPEDQAAITANMAGVVPVEFVEETEDAWNQGGSRPRDGGALVTFGPIRGTGDAVKVGLGVVCGNLCGYGTTLVLHDGSDGWTVTGTTGGSWIS